MTTQARGTIRSLPNADGSVRWSWSFRRKGEKTINRTLPFKRPEDRPLVEAKVSEWLAVIYGNDLHRPADVEHETVSEWFARYYAWRATTDQDVDTSRGRFRKWIEPRIGHIAMVNVSRSDLEDLVVALDDDVSHERLAWKTASNVWGEVTAGFSIATTSKRATGLRVLDANPAIDVEGPDKGTKRSKPVLRPAEIFRLLACVDVPIDRRHVYALAIYTAARQGELRALRVGDVDLDAMQISITKQRKNGKEKARTKTGRSRVVAIEPNLVPLLRALTEGRSPDAFLLSVGAHNRCASNLRSDLLTAGVDRKALHVETETTAHLKFHNLRDTCGTHMAVRRDPPQSVQWRLGHTTAVMTEKYIAQAQYEAGPNFGEPLAPLPPALIDPSADVIGVVICDPEVTKPLENKGSEWRRRESNPGPKMTMPTASTCVSGRLHRPDLRGPARSPRDYSPV